MSVDLLLMRGANRPAVRRLKAALAAELGSEAALFPGLLAASDLFDTDTEAALRRWRAGSGLIADGIAGPHCMTVLKILQAKPLDVALDLPAVRALFPQTKPSNIVRYLPYVTDALAALGLTDRAMVFAALGTIRAETAGFLPISEYPSKYNTLPGQPAFSVYEPPNKVAAALGNTQPGDGARYRGCGFVQLTGSDNYHRYTLETGLDIASQPELANAPEVAAVLLAMFLANRADAMRDALAKREYARARKLVNGGSHGLDAFKAVVSAVTLVGAGKGSRPAFARARVTRKDPPDLRDRLYHPAPVGLPEEYPPQSDVKAKFKDYAKLVLDQGEDFSCTGYGLACVINFALWHKSGWQPDLPSVSARMLYNYARRYDEYAGEDYDGSSCRGALKGWYHHGVCLESDWPDHKRPKYGYAQRALRTTLGVYYRIDTKSITDMQAAIVQAHAIYVSAFTHDGWVAQVHETASRQVPTHANLPAIDFDGKPSKKDGHAFAIVGFNARGFIIQNSWGARFGAGGFAVLTYADWLANGMDAWVASLGVPGVVEGMLASASAGAAGLAGKGANKQAWWDPTRAYEHSVVIGNDGRVARYLTQDELTRTLLYQACSLPDQWFRSNADAKKRLVIYAHGGLNSEGAAIDRARAMGRFFTGNGCYPLFLVWKTGVLESLADMLEDWLGMQPKLVGGLGEKIIEGTDLLIEKSLGRGPGKAVWSEMKENARFACTASRACDHLGNALQQLAATWGEQLEIHLVGHSAGSILLGYLLEVLAARGLRARIGTSHLFAPACTVQFANRYWATRHEVIERLWLHILSDAREKDDNVAAIYRKSSLYLVSNALEPDVRTPLLGMEAVLDPAYAKWDGSSTTMDALSSWRDTVKLANLKDRIRVIATPRATHGGFDNDVEVMSGTLRVITGGKLAVPVDDLSGF